MAAKFELNLLDYLISNQLHIDRILLQGLSAQMSESIQIMKEQFGKLNDKNQYFQ